jgi:hypothetical protein
MTAVHFASRQSAGPRRASDDGDIATRRPGRVKHGSTGTKLSRENGVSSFVPQRTLQATNFGGCDLRHIWLPDLGEICARHQPTGHGTIIVSWIIPRWIADRLSRQPTFCELPITAAARLFGAEPQRWCNAVWWLTRRPRTRNMLIDLLGDGLMREQSRGAWPEPRPGLKHACPVCRVPTLAERGGYEICLVCWWEDDGIVDEAWPSGCNGRTLAEARRQFADGLIAYDRSECDHARLGGGDPELESLKREILACAAGLRLMDDGPGFETCRDRLAALLDRLQSVTMARIRADEAAEADSQDPAGMSGE